MDGYAPSMGAAISYYTMFSKVTLLVTAIRQSAEENQCSTSNIGANGSP